MVRKSCLGTASGCISPLKCDVHRSRAPFGWYRSARRRSPHRYGYGGAIYIKDGDVMEVEIDGLGVLRLLKSPAVVRGAPGVDVKAHASSITSVRWNDDRLFTVGGRDRALLQWRVVPLMEKKPLTALQRARASQFWKDARSKLALIAKTYAANCAPQHHRSAPQHQRSAPQPHRSSAATASHTPAPKAPEGSLVCFSCASGWTCSVMAVFEPRLIR